MPSTRKKSPVSKQKRKTRASDKARTSPKKPRKNKSSVSANDGSYLQIQEQIPVSNVPSTSQNFMSVSTGQTIIEMLNKIDAANQELSKRMDRVERAGSVSSTPITSPTVPSVNYQKGGTTNLVPANTQPVLHRPNLGGAGVHGLSTVPVHVAATSDGRDAVVPKPEVLRSIPSISTVVSQLLASYDHQADKEALQGKQNVTRKKSGRYNTTETTTIGPSFRWPNEGLVSASHLRKPSYDDLTLAQWASGQIANILLVEDHSLSKNMLIQMAAAMRDAVSLPWPVVRSAWAVSMTDIEEGRLSWADSMQWSLNRISNSQLAMHNTQSVNPLGSKTRICRYFNEGSCSSEGHHGTYKHFCNFCYKQGRSLGHPEIRCFHRNASNTQDPKPSGSR